MFTCEDKKEYLQDILKEKRKALSIRTLEKTTVTKHMLNQFSDSYNAEIVYVNCEGSLLPSYTSNEKVCCSWY